MSDDAFWSIVPNGTIAARSYAEVGPDGVSHTATATRYSAAAAAAAGAPSRQRQFASIKKKMSHPLNRLSAPGGKALRMRSPAQPYKATGFAPRPSRSMVAGAARLPIRSVTSASKMPASFCYAPVDLTPTRDQGACGSCWAQAISSMMADRAYVASNGKVRCALSVQQVMECAEYVEGASSTGCEGNDPFTAAWTIKERPVLVRSEQDYPRKYTGDPSNAADCKPQSEADGAYACTATDAFMLCEDLPAQPGPARDAAIAKNVENMKQSLYNEGPLVVVFTVPDDFKDYDGLSIYQAPEGYDDQAGTDYHAVELVGWGTASDGQQYWVLRNSWGSGWPSQHKPDAGVGFFYMPLGKNACQIEQYCVGVVPKLVNESKAPKSPDNSFPGENGGASSLIGRVATPRGIAWGLVGLAAAGAAYYYVTSRRK